MTVETLVAVGNRLANSRELNFEKRTFQRGRIIKSCIEMESENGERLSS
jgi:hypothetical protein